MEIIRQRLTKLRPGFGEKVLRVDRRTLATRRWRGVAEDGREFGFDLEEPLTDDAAFFESEEHRYRIAQQPEPVLELSIGHGRLPLEELARIAWTIGNLHFQVEIAAEVIRVPDDPALRQLLSREEWKFVAREAVFHPLSGGPHHH